MEWVIATTFSAWYMSVGGGHERMFTCLLFTLTFMRGTRSQERAAVETDQSGLSLILHFPRLAHMKHRFSVEKFGHQALTDRNHEKYKK